jgi:aspartate/methionine/tyrosine aminotransferase
MRAGYQASRDRLAAALTNAGYAVQTSAATYFLCIDLPASGLSLTDREFCDRLIDEAGVAAIPVSAFYEEDPVTTIVRLCFAKRNATLDDAADCLRMARSLFA